MDVDGTIAETERDGHRIAFNRAFADAGLPWHWDVAGYGERLAITGGRERLRAEIDRWPGAPPEDGARDALARALHAAKNEIYARLAPAIPLRPGVEALFDACRHAGVAMAIATTTSRGNVAALLHARLGPRWGERFAAVVCGEDVQRKKPDPEVYTIALQRLALTPGTCVAVEDAPAGISAARAAGIAVVVTRSVYFAGAAIDGALAVVDGADAITLAAIDRLLAAVSR